MAGIDDATSRVTGGTFRAAEGAAGYFTAFAQALHPKGGVLRALESEDGVGSKADL